MASIDLSDGTFHYGNHRAPDPPSRRRAELAAWAVTAAAFVSAFVFGFGLSKVGLLISMAVAAVAAVTAIVLSP
ncbi:MAG TPA: hypothetical protein VMX12_02045 [Acidimicrobiia bacterium]|nr:hypothetical protein [Acidimicrobiia bacterium]